MKPIIQYVQRKALAAVIFTLLLFVLPVLFQFIYFSLMPTSMLMEVHSYQAQDVNLTNPIQEICVNRTLHYQFKGDWIDELYLTDVDTGKLIKTYTVEGSSIYASSDGDKQTFRVDLSDANLEPGTYYWSYAIKGHFPVNVKRTFIFESNEFEVFE
jgi:predicted membrane protein